MRACRIFSSDQAADDIPRVRVVLKVGFNGKRGPKGLLEQVKKAGSDVYKAKSFSDKDYALATLFYRIGGKAIASLAQRALGLPSLESIRRHSHVPTIRISTGYPTLDDVGFNIDSMYPTPIPPPANGIKTGYVLMVDEVKNEERPSWNPDTNEMVGWCREHSKRYDMKFRSMAEPLALAEALQEKKIHLAKEVRSSGQSMWISYLCSL